MASRDLRILVAGAGPGGLVAARALRDLGFRPTVLDMRPVSELLADVGGAYDFGREVIALFDALGVGARAREIGLRWSALRVSDGHGRSLRVLPLEGLEVLSLRRSELQRVLAEGLDDHLRCGARVVGVEDGDGPLKVQLEGGELLEADLLIGADGVHSAVREAVLRDGRPHFCDAMAAWGWLPSSHPTLEGYAPDQAHLLCGGPGMAMFGTVRDRTIWSLMWPASSYERAPTAEACHALARDVATRGVPGFLPVLEATPPEELAVVGIWDRDPAPRWSSGRVVLIGDAAHATSPMLGQGAQSAMVDGYVVARLLADHEPAEAFRRFEARRADGVNRNVLAARKVGEYVLSDRALFQWLGRVFFRWVPAGLLRRELTAANQANDLSDLLPPAR